MNNPLNFFRNMTLQTLDSWKTLMFFVIPIIVVGGYWFLNWKELSIALLIIALVFLGILVYYERQKTPIPVKKPVERRDVDNMTKKEKKVEDNEDEEEQEEDDEEESEEKPKKSKDMFDIGFDADKINKNIEKAIGW